MIQKYDYFSRWNTKSSHFEKFIFIQQWLTQNMRYIIKLYVFLIIRCKKIYSKFFSYEIWKEL
jgi:hypothetical protein